MGASLTGITELLHTWSNGDDEALSRLTSLVYEELHRLAGGYMSQERTDHILQSTALVNEIYLQLANVRKTNWQSRSHFFGVCSQMMRHILTDYARRRLQLKRGGEEEFVPLDENMDVANSYWYTELIALDDALRQLAAFDERKSKVVQLRFFGGFSLQETAAALNISERTVRKDWLFAKVWLLRELKNGKAHNG